MVTGVFLGAANSGRLYSHGTSASDEGTIVAASLTTNRVALGGLGGEVTLISAVIQMSANCTAGFKLIPIVDDVRYDGVNAPDCSVAFSVVGDGRTVMPMSQSYDLGLAQAWAVAGVADSRMGLRGTWVQFEIVSTTAIGNDVNGDMGLVFINGIQVEYQLLRGAKGVTVPAEGVTPSTRSPGYANNSGW